MKPERDYDKEALDTKDHKYAYNFDNVLRKYMMRSFLPFISDFDGRALEMGCNEGEFTEILFGHFKDLTVIEAAKSLVENTKQRVGEKVKFVNTTFEEYESEEKFDYVFLMHTLEHLDEPVEVLKKVNGWLAENGKLFLVCPNANAPSRQIAVKMGLISHNAAVTPSEYEHGHRITYSLDTLEREAAAADLNVVHRSGIFFKALANYQFDKLLALDDEIISEAYLEGCYKLGMIYPDLSASIMLVCERKK